MCNFSMLASLGASYKSGRIVDGSGLLGGFTTYLYTFQLLINKVVNGAFQTSSFGLEGEIK